MTTMAAFLSPVHFRATLPRTRLSTKPLISSRAERIPPYTPPSKQTLSTFSDIARGEWKGYEGRFTPEGKPLVIPDYYIPEEFSEWGLTPHGFESVHSIIVRENKLYRKFFRILPSVSLFADHVDTEEEFGWFELDHPGVTLFDDGSWIRGEERVKPKVSKLEKFPRVEVCIRHPRGGQRAVQAVLPFDWAEGRVVDQVRVVLEEWDCEYCDGADMDGGSGFVEGWVVGDSLVPLDGWSSDGAAGILLPEGIDFGAGVVDGDVHVWVGWCVDGERVVLRRRFDGEGNVLYSERSLETKSSMVG